MERPFVVIPGPSAHDLAVKIASKLGAPTVHAEVRLFSDGESKVRLVEQSSLALQDKSCVIVQSTHPPVDRNIMQTLMIAHGCKRLGAAEIISVVPYLGYARQDRAFLPGEVISIELVANLLRTSGISRLITVDVHSKHAESFFTIAIDSVSAMPLLAKYVSELGLNNPVAISPDIGGIERAKEFAGLADLPFTGLKKTRDRQTGEVLVDEKIDIDVTGRDVVLIDDMISSGMSIIKAAQVLLRNGAARVFAACTHALLIDNAASRMKEAGISDIIATNSIPNDYEKVDLSPILAEAVLNSSVINSSMGGRMA